MSVKIFKFKTRGHGIVSTEDIKKDTVIGNYFEKKHTSNEIPRYIYNGWFEHPYYGRYINHNRDSNCYLHLNENCIEVISKIDIQKNTEITINYFDIVNMLNMPDEEIKKHGIEDFTYIEEIVDLDKKHLF